MRNCMRRSGSGMAALRAAISVWISTAQSTASITDGNSARIESHGAFTMRPRCAATRSAKSARRSVSTRTVAWSS
jgi:hypothetical protein